MNGNISQKDADTIVVRIKKLLALSKSSNENEAALAASKAQELLLKYQVDIAQVENVDLSTKEHYTREFKEIFGKNRIQWQVDLANTIANNNLCRIVLSGAGVWWIGKPTNIEISQYMFETTMADLERIADEKWKQILALRDLQIKYPEADLFTDRSLLNVHGKTWKASFYVGAVRVIADRLSSHLDDLKNDNQNMMALVTTERKALKEAQDSMFGRLTSAKRSEASIYASAYLSGRAAGEKIQFRRGINGGSVPSGPLRLNTGK
jgi:hypothetical protein